jgi:putative transcriptional regulator
MITCKLAQMLKRRKLTMYRVWKNTGVTYPTLLKLTRNRAQMYDAQVLDKLCRTLHCQPGDLLVWEPKRFPRLPRRFPRLARPKRKRRRG